MRSFTVPLAFDEKALGKLSFMLAPTQGRKLLKIVGSWFDADVAKMCNDDCMRKLVGEIRKMIENPELVKPDDLYCLKLAADHATMHQEWCQGPTNWRQFYEGRAWGVFESYSYLVGAVLALEGSEDESLLGKVLDAGVVNIVSMRMAELIGYYCFIKACKQFPAARWDDMDHPVGGDRAKLIEDIEGVPSPEWASTLIEDLRYRLSS